MRVSLQRSTEGDGEIRSWTCVHIEWSKLDEIKGKGDTHLLMLDMYKQERTMRIPNIWFVSIPDTGDPVSKDINEKKILGVKKKHKDDDIDKIMRYVINNDKNKNYDKPTDLQAVKGDSTIDFRAVNFAGTIAYILRELKRVYFVREDPEDSPLDATLALRYARILLDKRGFFISARYEPGNSPHMYPDAPLTYPIFSEGESKQGGIQVFRGLNSGYAIYNRLAAEHPKPHSDKDPYVSILQQILDDVYQEEKMESRVLDTTLGGDLRLVERVVTLKKCRAGDPPKRCIAYTAVRGDSVGYMVFLLEILDGSTCRYACDFPPLPGVHVYNLESRESLTVANGSKDGFQFIMDPSVSYLKDEQRYGATFDFTQYIVNYINQDMMKDDWGITLRMHVFTIEATTEIAKLFGIVYRVIPIGVNNRAYLVMQSSEDGQKFPVYFTGSTPTGQSKQKAGTYIGDEWYNECSDLLKRIRDVNG